MQPHALIDKYYDSHKQAKSILLAHSHQVAKLAIETAEHINQHEPVDVVFIEQAALLHDIGIFLTDAPAIGCHGDKPYIAHGVLGAQLLRNENLPGYALVCERHIGVGLSVADIRKQKLPLPLRDMRPQTLEEKIIAYADLFFSKTKTGKHTVEKVRASLSRYGRHKVKIFDDWHERFIR
jgi:uncharacterized protein